MFTLCESLTVAPVLPATTLAASCYDFMFMGCDNLTYVKAMFLDFYNGTPGSGTSQWISNLSTGTFVMNANAVWDPASVRNINGIPANWTIQTATA